MIVSGSDTAKIGPIDARRGTNDRDETLEVVYDLLKNVKMAMDVRRACYQFSALY